MVTKGNMEEECTLAGEWTGRNWEGDVTVEARSLIHFSIQCSCDLFLFKCIVKSGICTSQVLVASLPHVMGGPTVQRWNPYLLVQQMTHSIFVF